MEKNRPTQEILLLTASSFAQGDLYDRNLFEDNSGKRPDPVENLQAACWNGLLKEWLPDTIKAGNGDKEQFLWKVTVANSFLSIEFGGAPSPVDYSYLLDPYLSLPSKNINELK